MEIQDMEFTKISEWIAAGQGDSGYSWLRHEMEEERRIAFRATRTDAAGQYAALCWIPKGVICSVENDVYPHEPKILYLVPNWVCTSRKKEGYSF